MVRDIFLNTYTIRTLPYKPLLHTSNINMILDGLICSNIFLFHPLSASL